MFLLVFLLGLLVGWMHAAHAATHVLAACTPAELIAKHAAASSGDTLKFPTCVNAGWGQRVDITKNVTLEGNGMTGTTYNTHLRQLTANGDGPMIRFNCAGSASVNPVVDGIRFEGRIQGDEQHTDIGVHLNNCVNFQVKNTLFHHFGIGLSVTGNPTVMKGVIYNNTFRHNARYTTALGYGIEVRGDGTWPTLTLGTLTNTFIEDNEFEANRHSVESTGGSRYVVRYNRFTKGRINSSTIDAHGPNQSSYFNGSRQWEIYHNSLDNTGSLDCTNDTCFAGIGLRGGDGTIFNNVIDNNGSREIVFWVEDDSKITNAAYRGCTCTPYPCRSQWTNVVNQTTEAHIWGNSPDNDLFFKGDPGSCHRTLLQEGRDYELFARPGYALTAIGGEFPPGKARVYPLDATYPHPLRTDPPSVPPGPPQLVTITPGP